MTLGSTTARRRNFELRAQAAERAAAERPRLYQLRVVAFALLGYGLLWSLLLLLIALAGGGIMAGIYWNTAVMLLLVKAKIGIAVLLGIAILARALWVRVEPPPGLRLDPRAVPALTREIDALRRAIGAPKVHELLLTPELNAAMVQTPRLGVFGWPRNSLVLGVQLLMALSPEQCRTVIAHELAHLSSRHARIGNWVYRARESWRRTMVAFDQAGGWSTRVLAKFFDWYAPAFAAYSFALARRNEYQADALAAHVTEPSAVGDALVRTHVLSDVINRQYWRSLVQRADSEPEPEAAAYSKMERYLARDLPATNAQQSILDQGLRQETGYDDTHPALRERLAALGETPRVPQPIAQSAAQAWLGEKLDWALQKFDADWLRDNATPWRETFAEAERSRAALTELRAKPEQTLTREESWQLATLAERFDRERDPLPAYRRLKEKYPDEHRADFAIGNLLAERGDAECLPHLEACAETLGLARASAEVAVRFLRQTGEHRAAEDWLRRAERAFDVERLALAERQSILPEDEYAAPELEASVLDRLRGQLRAIEDVEAAWIARKKVFYFPDRPLYVLAYRPTYLESNDTEIIRAIAEKVEAPGEIFIVRSGKSDAIVAKVTSAGVELFDRELILP